MKRISQCCLIFIILLSIVAGDVSAATGYNVGPREYELTSEFCTVSQNAQVSDNVIVFAENGSVTYDFYLIFNAASISFTYSASENVVLSVDCGNAFPYMVNLPASDTEGDIYTFAFTDALGKSYSEPKGERLFTFAASSAMQLHSVTFNKETIETADSYENFFLCDLSEDEQAIQTAVIVDQKASMLMVNGARRYINSQDTRETALTYKGRIYLPVHTLARALGYYYEDAPEKMYTLMRHENIEFCFTPDEAYKEVIGHGKENISDLRVYRNGITYLPLRVFAEALGKTVGYKEGIAVIDDKFSVADIINKRYSYINELFIPFRSYGVTLNEYHVAQTENASDANVGSVNSPFKTLARASEVARAGDTIIVHKGVYREILAPKNNGIPTAPIIFRAADGEKVVISATEEISNFTLQGDGIYTAELDWDLGDGRNQIFYQNESLVEARYPNESDVDESRALMIEDADEPYSILWPVAGDFSVAEDESLGESNTGSIKVTSDTLLNQEDDYWKGAYFVSMHGHGWSLHDARVESSTYGELTVTDMSRYFWPQAYDSDKWKYGYLSGHINALDAQGEWIIQDGTLYIIPPDGADTDNLTVEVKKRQLVADLSNCKYVQLKGFETIGGSIKMNNSEMCVLDGLKMSYLNHYIIGMDQHSGFIDDGNVNNPDGAPSRGEVGIYVGGKDNVIVNNTMNYAAAAAIYGVGRNIYIENNIIKECGYAGSYVSGLYFTTESWKADNTPRGGNSVYGNTVYRAGRAAIQFTRAAGGTILPHLPSEIAYNDFHDGTLTSLDTGIVYSYYVLLGHEKLFTNYHHNYVYYTIDQQNPYQMGIFHDGGSQNANVYNNVVFTTSENTWYNGSIISPDLRENAMQKYSIFSATSSESYAHCPEWNNAITDTVVGGPSALAKEHFPDQKPFYAGAGQNNTVNRINCDDYFAD